MLGERAGGTNTLHAMLMAVLVIAAALIVGVVVFDLEGSMLPGETHPSASFEYQYDETRDELTVVHRGGDALDPDRIALLNEGFEPVAEWVDEDGITAGDSTTISNVPGNATVYVMWETGDGEYILLGKWTGTTLSGTTATNATRSSLRYPPLEPWESGSRSTAGTAR